MKTITFYNEKGGVGKSTFTIMYASWLKYQHNINVAVVDFNNRQIIYRQDEIKEKEKLGILNQYNLDNIWPIIPVDKNEIRRMEKNKISSVPNARWLEELIRSEQCKDIDVMIVDLPGAVGGKEFIDFLIAGIISLYCLVIDRDPQTLRATLTVHNLMNRAGNNNHIAFFNQVQSYVTKKEYEDLAAQCITLGMKVLPDLISYTERMKKISEPDIIKSTLEYPDWNDKAFEGSRDLGTENLFIDITKELNKVPDLINTKKTRLDFADNLEKQFEEKRQLINNSFPEYSFEKTRFSKKRLEIVNSNNSKK